MNISAKTLIEFCNNNNQFSDSESENESLEEDEKELCSEKKDKVVIDQPVASDESCAETTVDSNKITIIVDSSNVSEEIKEIKCEPGWENIEFAELDDVIFDSSFTQIIKEKSL